jgi:hypothetical protein
MEQEGTEMTERKKAEGGETEAGKGKSGGGRGRGKVATRWDGRP